MLSGRGYYRGASVLISGTAGTGKTSIASHFAAASCARGERCVFFAFEESPQQLVRNMRSIGLDLQPWLDKKLLQIHSARPSLHGLEMHLALIHKAIRDFQPHGVVIDPISNFLAAGTTSESKSMLTRLVDHLKSQQITAVFTSLIGGMTALEENDVGISSIIDTWILVRDIEIQDARTRGLFLLKSRGMPHSNQVREFLLTDHGIELADAHELHNKLSNTGQVKL
jgi:circadian clock protein KaiC